MDLIKFNDFELSIGGKWDGCGDAWGHISLQIDKWTSCCISFRGFKEFKVGYETDWLDGVYSTLYLGWIWIAFDY